jgi:hypothetical protein
LTLKRFSRRRTGLGVHALAESALQTFEEWLAVHKEQIPLPAEV